MPKVHRRWVTPSITIVSGRAPSRRAPWSATTLALRATASWSAENDSQTTSSSRSSSIAQIHRSFSSLIHRPDEPVIAVPAASLVRISLPNSCGTAQDVAAEDLDDLLVGEAALEQGVGDQGQAARALQARGWTARASIPL